MHDSIEEKKRFATLLTGLSEYYGKEVSKALAGIYWDGLKQYNFEAISKVCQRHMASPDENGRWFPKIADITKYLEGSTEDQAELAWSKVDKAIRQVGVYADVVFDDPVIHAVLQDMGGWILLGDKDDEAWPFIGKEFKTRYRGYRQKTQQPEYPARLIGVANAHNAANGQPLQPPRLVGDMAKCKEVLRLESAKKLQIEN